MSKQRNPNGLGTYKRRKDGRCEWRQKVDGKARYLSAKTPKELQEKIKKVADLPIIKEKYTVDEWFQKWLKNVISLKKAATYNQYSEIYNIQIKPVIGKRKLAHLKTSDIQHVIAVMNEKGLSTKTMKHAKSIMNIALKKAKKEKIIPENPVVDIEIPVKQAKPRKTLRLDELAKLFEAMNGSRWIWSVKFDLVTGLRRGELLALKWTDIDWENRRIIIAKSDSITGLGDTKNSKIHYVPLNDDAIKYLKQQKNMLEREFNPCFYSDELKKDPLVFPSITGKMIRPDSYYTLIRRFAIKADIKASPHCFRHTFVYFTRKDLSLTDLQNILGHSESTTTLDIYGNMIDDNMDKNIDTLNNVFDNVDAGLEKVQNNIAKKKAKKENKKGKVIQLKIAK